MCENVLNVNSHLSRLLAVVPHDISEKLKSQISVGSVGRLFLNNSVEFAQHWTQSIGIQTLYTAGLNTEKLGWTQFLTNYKGRELGI